MFRTPPLLLLFLAAVANAGVIHYVDQHIGSGGQGYGAGNDNVVAQIPFGVYRAGPDTTYYEDIWLPFDHTGGYYYYDNHITAFSHVRLVGAGVPDLGNIGIMPTNAFNEKLIKEKNGYRSKFSHENEKSLPGFYSVLLETPQVVAELVAAGSHSGIHRYSFEDKKAKERTVLIDVCHNSDRGKGGCKDANVQINADGSISGFVLNDGSLSGRSPQGGVAIYFSLHISDNNGQNPLEQTIWANKTVLAKDVKQAHGGDTSGGSLGVLVRYPAAKTYDVSASIEVRVGISFVSVEQAEKNLQIQAGNATFDELVTRVENLWEKELSVLQLDTINTPSKTLVKTYTALYHTMCSPSIYTEEGGVYLGFDDKVHVYNGTGHLYTDMSIWDIHRSEVPFLNLIKPNVGIDIIKSIEVIARDGGDIPKWPLANVYTGCMSGQHTFIMIADALTKGLINSSSSSSSSSADIDLDFLYSVMVKEATVPTPHSGRSQIDEYVKQGFISQDTQHDGTSLTLEYAFDDWAVSVVAQYLNDTTNESLFRNRSLNYKNVFAADKEFMCPRYQDGSFHCRHETELYFLNQDYVEGNAWQWTFFVPHDPLGLVKLFPSGKEGFAKKLNDCFERSTFDVSNVLPNLYYWAGNEPDLLHVWLFPFASRADLTQKWSRWLVNHKYNEKPDGIPGNDDYGTMSAWLAFASLGFYPLAGHPVFVVGSPNLPAANLTVNGDKMLQIVAHNWSESTLYVEKVLLNGVALPAPFLTNDQVTAGGLLEFFMVEKPAKWGNEQIPDLSSFSKYFPTPKF